MTTKLDLYNGALGHLGPVRFSVVTENRPDRYELDAVYSVTLQSMLERGLWFFALRSIEWNPDTDVTARFGLPYTYSLPTDYVRIRLIATDEAQRHEDRTYKREGNFIFSSYPVLYLTYVSNDPSYGLNLGAFTQLYADAVAVELAYRSGLPITQSKGTKNDLLVIKKRMLVEAQRKEAVDERVKGKPTSSWVNSRRSGGTQQHRAPTT